MMTSDSMIGVLHGVPSSCYSAERRALLAETAQDLLQRTLQEYRAFHRQQTHNRWRLMKENFPTAAYIDQETSEWTPTEAGRRTFMASGMVPGSATEVLRGMYADTTDTYQIVNHLTYPGSLLDCSLVHVFQKAASEAPVMLEAVTWVAVQPHPLPFQHPRELVSYERMGFVCDENNDRYGYRLTIPIDTEQSGNSASSRNYQSNYTAVLLYRDVGEACVRTFAIVDSIAPKLFLGYIADRMIGLGGSVTLHCIQVAKAKALSALVRQNLNRKASSSTRCDLCEHSPALLTKLRVCKGCSRQVCRRCRCQQVVFRLNVRTKKAEKEMFCSSCIMNVQFHDPNEPVRLSPTEECGSNSSASELGSMEDKFGRKPWFVMSPSDEVMSILSEGSTPFLLPDDMEASDLVSASEACDGTSQMTSPKSYRESEVEKELSSLLGRVWSSHQGEVEWNADERHRFSTRCSTLSSEHEEAKEPVDRVTWGSLEMNSLD